MAPTLYHSAASPPVRAVLMTAKTIGLDLNLRKVDLANGEQRSEWYLKLNPQHSVPVLVDDDGFTIWDSHAINPYIVSKYAQEDSLYPKDLQKRAIIDQRLHFDTGVAFNQIAKIMRPLVFEHKTTIPPEDIEFIDQIYAFLEIFLEGHQWIAGDSVTIADLNLIPTVTSLNIFRKVDDGKFPKVGAWLKRAEGLPVYDINRAGLEAHAERIKLLLSKK